MNRKVFLIATIILVLMSATPAQAQTPSPTPIPTPQTRTATHPASLPETPLNWGVFLNSGGVVSYFVDNEYYKVTNHKNVAEVYILNDGAWQLMLEVTFSPGTCLNETPTVVGICYTDNQYGSFWVTSLNPYKKILLKVEYPVYLSVILRFR